jgi:hypothetical protein
MAAACGGGGKTTATVHSASTATTSPAASGSATDCNRLGINPTGMREGTCTESGTTYVIVDENHTLKLHTLSAHLQGVRADTALGGSSSTTPNGKFVVLALALTNRLPVAQIFDAAGTQQAALLLRGTIYNEDTSAEHGSDPNSCLKHAGSQIPAGHTVTCDVVFNVPAAAAADFGKHGSGDIYLVDFGVDLSGNTPARTIGQIRLYR